MEAASFFFRGHHCFKDGWAGFDGVAPVTVVIGRNNSGKSKLLDLVEAHCIGNERERGWGLRFTARLQGEMLEKHFSRHTGGGDLSGRHWEDNGLRFVGALATWEVVGAQTSLVSLVSPSGEDLESAAAHPGRLARLKDISARVSHPYRGRIFRRVAAERDIVSESPSNNMELSANGDGATNLIRRFIVTSSAAFPRSIVQSGLLEALNSIFGPDGNFTEIAVRNHDDERHPRVNTWEVFLAQERKGLVSLSDSGSGLKTVILVLLNLLVMPHVFGRAPEDFVYAFEEIENNLHPALLRRLLAYLRVHAESKGSAIFLTTHSSTMIDVFGLWSAARIIHVVNDGERAQAIPVELHLDKMNVVSELGAKPSDLLQSNGVIWVEGPSDRVYLNRWIDLISDGAIQEGRDYQCAFYGGALLARLQFVSPEDAEVELVNLFRVSANFVVVCDGDRSSEKAKIKDRVRRISRQVRDLPRSHIWVTQMREIENYTPGSVLSAALEKSDLPSPSKFEPFFPRKREVGGSYVEKNLGGKSPDKVELAVMAAAKTDRDHMLGRYDLMHEIAKIVDVIKGWNA